MALNNEAWLRVAWLGQHTTGEELASIAKTAFESHGDTRGQAQSLTILAGVRFAEGDTDRALSLGEDALALLAQAQDYWLEAQALRELALIQVMSGHTAAAAESARRGLGVCEEVGLPDLAPTIRAVLAWSLLKQHQLEEALGLSSRAIADSGPGVEFSHLIYYVHALALRSAGRILEADEHLLLAADLVKASIRDVPAHERSGVHDWAPLIRRILASAEARTPRQWIGPWPRADAPLGRHLGKDDYVTVTLTTWHPTDDATGNRGSARLAATERIVGEALTQGSVPGVVDIAGVLGVSVATTRRDLKSLRDSGVPIRTRGSGRS
jgi:tetratricopeptide (TPR) repeat protein